MATALNSEELIRVKLYRLYLFRSDDIDSYEDAELGMFSFPSNRRDRKGVPSLRPLPWTSENVHAAIPAPLHGS